MPWSYPILTPRLRCCGSYSQPTGRAISHLWDDILDKDPELFALLFRIAPPVTYDNAAIAQINQVAEVIYNVRLGACASIAAAVCSYPGFPNINKELMAQAEIRKASPLRLAQLLE